MTFAAAANLAKPLAELYLRPNDTERLLHDAGLEVIRTRVNLEQAAASRWFSILLYASDTRTIAALLAQVREEQRDPELWRKLDDPALLVDDEVPAPAAEPAAAVATGPSALPHPALPRERELIDRVDETAFLAGWLESVVRRPASPAPAPAPLDGAASPAADEPVVRLVIRGDSGVGKTRLVEHAVRHAGGLGMAVMRAQCLNRRSEPHAPIRQAVNDYRGGSDLARLLEAAGLPPAMPLLAAFLGVAEPDPTRTIGSEDVNAAITQLLVALGGRGGACLVVEDLNDADRDTLSFVEYVARAGRGSGLAAIVTVKDDDLEPELTERLGAWAGEPATGSRSIPPLTREDTERFVSLLRNGGPAVDPKWLERVWEQSGGNPFFVEQLVRLASEAALDEDDDTALGEVPEGIEEVVRRRLGHIADTDPDLRWFLGAAAVALELTRDLQLVAEVAQIDADTAATLRDRAVQARLLATDDQGALRFGQTVIGRVLTAGIAGPVARPMHERAARWLEARGMLGSASHHYRLAGRIDDMVRTAVAGAEQAKGAGSYRAAAQLYGRAATGSADPKIQVELARMQLILGAWAAAEKVLGSLPDGLGDARLLQAQLSFVRGDFEGAQRELRYAAQATVRDRTSALLRLADVYLYLGRLADARDEARKALETASDGTTRSSCLAGIGASLYHMGDLDGADEQFLEQMRSLPVEVEQRDRFAYTMALHNLAMAREARGEWPAALQLHQEALRIRTEASAAREVGHSTHAVLRCRIALGDLDTARTLLGEARGAALALGDEIEQGKLDHTEANLVLAQGGDAAAAAEAVRLVRGALARFRRLGVAYDVAHASLTLAQALAATGATRRSIEEAAGARATVDRMGFGLLSLRFPDTGFGYADRIRAGLQAYAAGDAVGLPWEGRPAGEVAAAELPSLHATGTWAAGATSDDTALTLLVARHLVESGSPDPDGFMARLAAAADGIPGLGPSTTAAIEAFRAGRPAEGGNTNGALMRSLPIGWALPIDRAEDRRAWCRQLSAVTHHGAEAMAAASVGAALASWALEGAPPATLLEIAREEAAATVAELGADPRIEAMLAAIPAGTWVPDPAADDLDPYETLTRVVACVASDASLPDALLRAVRMGGDTDTVAAIVGGIRGCGMPSARVREAVSWLDEVSLPPADDVDALAGGLRDLRLRFADG